MTELDHCVLGVIWREGPLTAYGVRTHFSESPTPAWSSSTGSVYPAIQRLLRSGLVAAEPVRDRRGTQALGVTSDGLLALQAWLLAITPAVAGPTPDPIRTRAQFIHALDAADATSFLQRATAETRAKLAAYRNVEGGLKGDEGRRLDYLATVGATFELQARLKWLGFLARELRQ